MHFNTIMKKFCNWLIDKRSWALAVMLAVFVLCGLMVPKVNVNTDMTKYLPKNSPMKKGLDRMAEALGTGAMNSFSVRAMYSGLDSVKRDSLAVVLRQLDGVTMLTSVQDNGQYTLYDLSVDASGDPKAVASEIRQGGLEVMVETSIDGNLPDPIVFIIAALLVFGILFLMCESWVEPLLFLATIGVAVIMNVGSNALLPSVSMTTNAIVAILQLVLSMDYSIILMNRYRQEKAKGGDKVEAMKNALFNASSSVLSSAFTTIAGLLMLCFMEFRIGMDLGIVLAKGVSCSVLCLFTVLPALILAFDKAVERSHKRVFVPNTDRLTRFEMRFRIPLAVAAVLIFGAAYYLHNFTNISFSTNWPTSITEQFPRKNTVVLLYKNADEDKIVSIAEDLSANPDVDTVVSYPTLMLRQQNVEEMYASLKGMTAMMPPEAAVMVDSLLTPDMLTMLFDMMSEPPEIAFEASSSAFAVMPEVVVPEVVENEIAEHIPVSAPVHEVVAVAETQETPVEAIVSDIPAAPQQPQPTWRDTISTPMSSTALAAYLGFDAKQAKALYRMAGKAKGTMSPYEFVCYVKEKVLPNKLYSSFISATQKQQLNALYKKMHQVMNAPVPEPVSEPIMVEAVAIDNDTITLIDSAKVTVDTMISADTHIVSKPVAKPVVPITPTTSVSSHKSVPATCSLAQLVNFVGDVLPNDPAFAPFIDDSLRSQLGGVREMMDEGVGQLKGEGYSMAAIVTSYPDEGDDIQQFLASLRHRCDEDLGENNYSLIGESVMFDEMRAGFKHELMMLTLLTILAIFLIVALTFRSVLVPVVLVMTVLSGVYVNVFVSGLGGRSMLYLAYLIVQSILMGATIDYAILFTNYYREHRLTQSVADSLQAAYRGSIRTILTSGLIIVLAPGIMAMLVTDHTIASIVGCLAVGGLAAILLILFVLPGLLAALDPFVTKKRVGKNMQ